MGDYSSAYVCKDILITLKKLDWHQTKADGYWDDILAKVSKWTVYLHATKAYSSEIHQYFSIIPDVKWETYDIKSCPGLQILHSYADI